MKIYPILVSMFSCACVTALPEDIVDNYRDGYTTVAISPDGRMVAAANRFIVVLFNIERRRKMRNGG